jgi:hypothetical protein
LSVPPDSPPSAAPTLAQRAAALHRLAVVTLLGFASGLPLALTGQALQAWLTLEGIDIATIGFLSLAGLPYTFKFLWAPLMDRFDLPWLGRRRLDLARGLPLGLQLQSASIATTSGRSVANSSGAAATTMSSPGSTSRTLSKNSLKTTTTADR